MGPCHSSSKKAPKNAPCPNIMEKLTRDGIFIETKENTYKRKWEYSMPTFMDFNDNPMFLCELFEATLHLEPSNTFSIKISSKCGSKLCKCTDNKCFDFLTIDLTGTYESLSQEGKNETLKLNCQTNVYNYYHVHGDKREDEVQNAQLETNILFLQVSKEEEYRGNKGYMFKFKREQ